MNPSVAAAARSTTVSWREEVWPKEHGSWSLALEPLALGLLAAPSWPGIALSAATVAAFFLRRPIKLAFGASHPNQRHVAGRGVGAFTSVATAALGAAVILGDVGPLWLLTPALAAGLVFVAYDLRGDGRRGMAGGVAARSVACGRAAGGGARAGGGLADRAAPGAPGATDRLDGSPRRRALRWRGRALVAGLKLVATKAEGGRPLMGVNAGAARRAYCVSPKFPFASS